MCTMAGETDAYPQNCPGPCPVEVYVDDNGEVKKFPYSAKYPPNNPVEEVFKRGQTVTVKYTRNNHGPGGFNRFALVRYINDSKPEKSKDYMNKAIHTRNAFHYSCWGAKPVVATEAEATEEGEFGLSAVGSDGQDHDLPKAYYVDDVVIPPVVPDGLYMLGFAWFGGTSTGITTNDPQVPGKSSWFPDYWGCSFIKIEGGVPLAQSYAPVFKNTYTFDPNAKGAEGMENGCMAANDRPGVCVTGTCPGVNSFFRKPAAFKDGPPRALTPSDFGGEITEDMAETAPSPSPSTSPPEKVPLPLPSASPAKEAENRMPTASPSPMKEEKEAMDTIVSPSPMEEEVTMSPSPAMSQESTVSFTDRNKALRTCSCLYNGSRCPNSYAETTYGCKGGTLRSEQPDMCKKVCCDLCKPSKHFFCEYIRKNHCSALK